MLALLNNKTQWRGSAQRSQQPNEGVDIITSQHQLPETSRRCKERLLSAQLRFELRRK